MCDCPKFRKGDKAEIDARVIDISRAFKPALINLLKYDHEYTVEVDSEYDGDLECIETGVMVPGYGTVYFGGREIIKRGDK